MKPTLANLILFTVFAGTWGNVMAQGNMSQNALNITSFVRDHERIRHAGTLRQAGLRMDRSQVPTLMHELDIVNDDIHLYSALHSLAQIGDVRALPTVDALLKKSGLEEQNYCFAKVARARLVAEEKAEHVTDPQQKASVRLKEFLAALGIEASSLNAVVAQEQQRALGTTHSTVGTGVFALRGLADMVYRRRDMVLAATAKESGIDFSVEPGAKVKLQLAPLSSQERVAWIITTLSQRKAEKKEDNFLIQLAADEGALASHAVAERLSEMDQHRAAEERQGIFSHAGYSLLFDVLRSMGDPTQEPVLRRYVNDPHRGVRHYANLDYEYVRDGAPLQARIGY